MAWAPSGLARLPRPYMMAIQNKSQVDALANEAQRRLSEALHVALRPYSSKPLGKLDMTALLKLVWEQACGNHVDSRSN